jgi:hypothetical protein
MQATFADGGHAKLDVFTDLMANATKDEELPWNDEMLTNYATPYWQEDN